MGVERHCASESLYTKKSLLAVSYGIKMKLDNGIPVETKAAGERN